MNDFQEFFKIIAILDEKWGFRMKIFKFSKNPKQLNYKELIAWGCGKDQNKKYSQAEEINGV